MKNEKEEDEKEEEKEKEREKEEGRRGEVRDRKQERTISRSANLHAAKSHWMNVKEFEESQARRKEQHGILVGGLGTG